MRRSAFLQASISPLAPAQMRVGGTFNLFSRGSSVDFYGSIPFDGRVSFIPIQQFVIASLFKSSFNECYTKTIKDEITQFMGQARVIVLGNEKGGTGKSTVSMHIITYLLKHGYTVASIDIDARQGTLTRYLQNRLVQKSNGRTDLAVPDHHEIFCSQLEHRKEAEEDEAERFDAVFEKCKEYDFLVIDTPGNNTFLSRYAHSHADMIITPINDSFIDLDMLVRLDPTSKEILKPSLYAENVWEQKKVKAIRNQGTIDWIVVRNRKNIAHAKGKNSIEPSLTALSKRIGFRFVCGFSERIIFKELFLEGMTLTDIDPRSQKVRLAHVAARQELTQLMDAILNNSNQQKQVAS